MTNTNEERIEQLIETFKKTWEALEKEEVNICCPIGKIDFDFDGNLKLENIEFCY